MNKDGDALNILEELDVDGAKHNELTLQAFVQCYKVGHDFLQQQSLSGN